MAKRFKLKFSVPSFQICRSKNLSDLPGNPVPAIYRLSPVNPKSRDIGYPTPPLRPEDRFAISCDCKLSSKVISVADGRPCKACKSHVPYDHPTDFSASACRQKTHCESISAERNHGKEKKVKARGISSGTGDLLVNKLGKKDDDNSNDNDKGEEWESLISCMTSFSDEFFDEIDHPLENASLKPDKDIGKHRRQISSIKKVRRLRFQTSRNRTGLEIGETRKTVMSTKTGCSITRRGPTRSCRVEGKVKESFALVKKSKDPYDDFKRSMLEMIMEMEMFEATDLEQLLQCFLTLNSRRYHGVIVQAFMAIWKELFYEFCVDPKSP